MMKSSTVNGRFSHQHCSNKSHKCHTGQTKPTLLFKKPSTFEPEHCSFSALFQKKDVDVDLGPVDKNWFEKALGNENGAKELPSNNLYESNPQKLISDITEMSARHRCRNNQQQAVTPQLSSPCLFTPRKSVSQQTSKQQHHHGQTSPSTSRHSVRNAISPVTPSLIPITPSLIPITPSLVPITPSLILITPSLVPITPSLVPITPNLVPITPSLVPITPNLLAGKQNPAKWTPARLDASPSSQDTDPTEDDPSMWFPAHKQTTPTFMKQLFKTPSTVSKLEDISIATPGQFLSTPLRMSVSLGADLDDSNLSWTSSLATPLGSTKKTNTLTLSHVDRVPESTVVAKALFTSATKTPEEHIQHRRLIDPDSPSSTLPLQSLHMSSAEEEDEMLEDTMESDDADDGFQREDKVDDVDVMQHSGGRTVENCQRLGCGIMELCTSRTEDLSAKKIVRKERLAGEESQRLKGETIEDTAPRNDGEEAVVKTEKDEQVDVGGATAEQACSDQNMQALMDGLTNEPYSTELDKNKECLSSQVNVNQRDNCPTLTPGAVLAKNYSKIASSFESTIPSRPLKQSSEGSQTNSQRSLENITVNDLHVLEASGRPGLNQNRMEDTLAFFLLTPPQTKSRLAKLKNKPFAKDGSREGSVHGSSLDENREVNSKSPALTSLEESKNLQMPTRTDHNHELLVEIENSAPTKIHTSVITLKEEDGSLKDYVENLSDLSLGFINPGINQSLSDLHPVEDGVEVFDTSVSKNKGDNMLDACEADIKSSNVHSPEILAHPSTLSEKAVHVAQTILSPTLPIQNAAAITSVRQTQLLVSTPNINSPDIFSQISPTFAEALCTITDQVSESHLSQSVLPPVPEENKQSSNKLHSQTQCKRTPVSCNSPLLPSDHNSKLAPLNVVSNCTLEQTTVSESKGLCQQNVPESCHNQETSSQLFRMQPKAATTRKFFYPSSATSATKTNKPMEWVVDAVLVKAEGKHQQQSAQEILSEPKQEMSLFGKTNNEAPTSVGAGSAIYSSTPAPRNSAFVTFTNFIKSERSSASGTANPTRLTPVDNTTSQSLHQVMPSFKSHQQATQAHSIPVNSRSNSVVPANETTPLSRRTVAPQSNSTYCGTRRRAGNHDLPAPKRLKTIIEHDKEQTETGEMQNQVKPSDRLPPDKTTLRTGGPRISALEKELPEFSDVEVTDANLCTTLKRNDVKQQASAQMDLSTKTSTGGIIPASVSFASASGKVIGISHSAMKKAKKLWSESEDEIVPNSVCFASARGKAIQISDFALTKAAALFGEADEEQSVHPRVAFPAPTEYVPVDEEGANVPQSSRKGIDAPDCALRKAMANQREQIVSLDPVSASMETVPVVYATETVGPSLASMKAIKVLDSNLYDASPYLQDEHDDALSGGTVQNMTKTSSTQESEQPDKDNLKAEGKPGTKFGKNNICSGSGQLQDGKMKQIGQNEVKGRTVNGIPGQVPSFSGFASASGKTISVSKAALQRAQQLCDDAEIDIQPNVGFASAAGRPFQISESDLKKAKALLDDWKETNLPTPKAQCHLQEQDNKTIGRSSAMSATRNTVQQRLSKPQTTNQNLPKGFRPFKAPAAVHIASGQKTPVKDIAQVGRLENSLKANARTSDHDVPLTISPKHLQSIPESSVMDFPRESLKETKMTMAEGMEFEEEFLSASQAQREIEAAEEMESAYAFMQAENDSFSQLEEITINKSPGCPVENENSVAAEQNSEKSENLKSEIVADEQMRMHSIPSSQVSSQASDALDKAFVQSQSSEVGDGETEGSFQADNHQGEVLIKSEHQFNSNMAAAVSKNTAKNYSKPSLPVVDGSFMGFQTAAGTKVTLSEEALQKAKKLLETEINTENDYPLETKRTCRMSGKSVNQNTKTNFTPDQIVSGFQTGRGNMLLVSRESFDQAKKLISEISEQFDQQPKNNKTPPVTCSQLNVQSATVSTRTNNKMTAKVAPSFSGFQTAGGRNVSVSEEALKRAKNLFSEEEIIDSNLPTGNMPPHGCSHWQTTDNVMDQPDGAVCDEGQTIESKSSSLDVSQTKPYCVREKSDESSRNPGLRRHIVKAGGDAQPFTTASGNKVTISQESLQQAKRFFEDPQEGFAAEEIASVTPRTIAIGPSFRGFSTASGNKVSVSEAALEGAKKLWQNSDDGLEAPVVFDEKSSSPDCKRRRIDRKPDVLPATGFQTASGSKVSISEASLQKARHLLDNSPQCSNPTRKASSGFQTASGNKVSVSEDSLANAQRLLADSESAPEHGSRDQGKPLLGFSTASGAQVSVSKAALENAKRFFQESDDILSVSNSDHKESSNAVANQAFSKTHPHAEGDNNDAVVPNFGGRATNRTSTLPQKIETKVAVNMSSLHPGPLAKPQMTSATKQRSLSPFPPQGTITSHKPLTAFKPPFQAAKDRTPQPRPRPGKLQGGLQVVPETAIPLLPPKLGIPLSCDKRQEGVQPNKRALNPTNKDGLQACGPVPKRARREVGVDRKSGPTLDGNISSSMKQETNLSARRWEQARRKQASRIHSKKTQVIKPQPGKLFTKRHNEPRVPLCELVNGQPPQQYSSCELVDSGVLRSTLTVTSSTAEAFRFSLGDHYSLEALETSEGLVLGDEGRLVPDDVGTAGKEEFLHALLDTPGVDPKLLTSDWVDNHYRWIVWKLAAMERAYPRHLGGRLLTPDWVLLQLKYRYDTEIDHTQRSALKKILERDDAPSRRIVLCVAGIHLEERSTGAMLNQEGTSGKENEKISSHPVPTVELTDGWYSIRTVIDKPLAGLVSADKIHIGLKLCIYGAELVGSQDACSPLEVPASLRLKISANATRRARYDARLGLQRHPQPFPLTLASLYSEGGPVGCVDVVVVRTYPMQFMEKHSEGGCTFRGRRAEEKEAARFAQEKQKRMERLYNQIHKEYQEKENKKANPNRRSSSAQKLTAKEVEKLYSGQELYVALNDAMDPGAVEALLSKRQMAQLDDYQRSLNEKKQADLRGQFKRALEDKQQEGKIQRSVTPLLRVRVADYLAKSGSDSATYQLTVWRPADDVMQLLSEGKRLKIFNLSTSAGRFCVGSSSVQLASTRGTRYQAMPFTAASSTAVGSTLYQPRKVMRFTEALRQGFQPACGEVDVVGVVITLQGAATNPGQSSSQVVYLSDAQGNFIAIKFWGGLQAHCLETLVTPGAVIATASLQWRSNSASSSIPCLHAADTTSVTQSPKADHLKAALQDLQNQIKNPNAFAQSMEPFAMDVILQQSRHPAPVTPKPENVLFGTSPWSDRRPTRDTTTPSATPEMGHSLFGRNAPSFNPDQNHQSFPSPAPANWTSQLRPNAASTPLLPTAPRSLAASSPGGRMPVGLVSPPVMTPQDKRRLDVSRRYDLLSRVPSPPPLSPLPTPLTSRRSIPRQGLSYRSTLRNTSGLRGQGSGVKYNQGCAVTESVQLSEDLESANDVDKRLDATCKSDNSSEEDMTPSQRQIQEVLGMSYKSLGEIDLEWTQQVDSRSPQSSEPSPDFSYDTPSQSSPIQEECLPLSKANSKSNSAKLNKDDTKFLEGRPAVTTPVNKNDCVSNKLLTNKKNLSLRSRRGRIGKDTSVVIPGVSSHYRSSQEEKVMSKTEDQKAEDNERDNQKNEQQAFDEVEMKRKEKHADEDKNQLKDAREGFKEETLVKEENSRQDKQAVSDNTTTGQQMPSKPVSGQKKRRARSRADLSILEQSSFLGNESGEPTRRLTRSASRRSTVE